MRQPLIVKMHLLHFCRQRIMIIVFITGSLFKNHTLFYMIQTFCICSQQFFIIMLEI